MRGRGWEGGVSKLFNWEFNGKDEIYIKDMINTSIVCTKQREKKSYTWTTKNKNATDYNVRLCVL